MVRLVEKEEEEECISCLVNECLMFVCFLFFFVELNEIMRKN